jgi:hypothetical protein
MATIHHRVLIDVTASTVYETISMPEPIDFDGPECRLLGPNGTVLCPKSRAFVTHDLVSNEGPVAVPR